MTEKRVRLDRRHLLSTTAGVGAGAAGCLGQERQPGDTAISPDVGPSQQQTPGEVPSSSGRVGDAVFYDPDGDGGPYADGQEALEDVPSGGTFYLGHGTWDVAEEGRLLIEKTVHIQGMGRASAREDPQGTQIVNTGSDAIDEPAVEFNGTNLQTEEQNPRIYGSLRNVSVRHHGDAPAVLLRRAIKTTITDCSVDCEGKAPKGLKYETWGFFSRALRNTVVGATEICTQVSGVGYAHEFYSNHFATGTDEAVAFQTERHRSILIGGECAATGEDGIGIRFYNPSSTPIYGGVVVEPGIEHTEHPVVIDGDSPVENIQIYGSLLDVGTDEGAAVRFGNAKNCKLIYPVLRNGKVAHWTDQCQDCGVLTDVGTLAGATYTDEGAVRPFVSVRGTSDNSLLGVLPTGVPTFVEYNEEAGAPVVHDGDRWRAPSMQDHDI
jgi:hypothetical protein